MSFRLTERPCSQTKRQREIQESLQYQSLAYVCICTHMYRHHTAHMQDAPAWEMGVRRRGQKRRIWEAV